VHPNAGWNKHRLPNEQTFASSERRQQIYKSSKIIRESGSDSTPISRVGGPKRNHSSALAQNGSINVAGALRHNRKADSILAAFFSDSRKNTVAAAITTFRQESMRFVDDN